LSHPYVEVEDSALAILKFRNGGLGSVTVSLCQKPGIYTKIHVHGSNGASVGAQTDTGATFIAGMSDVVAPPMTDLWTIPGEEQGEAPISFPGNEHYHALQVQDFLHAILEDRAPSVTGLEGRKVVELITAIYQSSNESRSIRL